MNLCGVFTLLGDGNHLYRLRDFSKYGLGISTTDSFITYLAHTCIRFISRTSIFMSWGTVFLQDCICALRRLRSKACSNGQRVLWSACADVQADQRLCWAQMQSCRKCCANPSRFPLQIHIRFVYGMNKNVFFFFVVVFFFFFLFFFFSTRW